MHFEGVSIAIVTHSADDPRDPISSTSATREIFTPLRHDDEIGALADNRPPLALPKKPSLTKWLAIALLLGGLIALALAVLMSG